MVSNLCCYHDRLLKGNKIRMVKTELEGSQMAFQCGQCELSFDAENSLKKHFSLAHCLIPPFNCLICDRTFAKRSSFVLHLRLKDHEAKIPWSKRKIKCQICHFSMQMGSLKSHLQSHANVKSHECSECGKGFTRITSLTR